MVLLPDTDFTLGMVESHTLAAKAQKNGPEIAILSIFVVFRGASHLRQLGALLAPPKGPQWTNSVFLTVVPDSDL